MPLRKPIILASLLGLCLFGNSLQAGEVRLAVAANFIDAAREIAALFEEECSHTTLISYGSTGKLYAQIEHGAPFEVFLSADRARAVKAETEGLAVAGSHFVYALGQLVLWSLKPDRFKDGEQFLKQGELAHLAMANPKTAPYGLAARQTMQHLKLQQRLTSKLVQGDSIAQTFQFVATGNADAGFVALAQIKGWEGEPGTLWEIPDEYHAPIEQAAVLLNKGSENPAAVDFLEFLRSDAAREVIERYGYGVE